MCATATQLAGNETGENLLLAGCGMDEGGEQERRRAARCIPQFTTIHSALFTVGASTAAVGTGQQENEYSANSMRSF